MMQELNIGDWVLVDMYGMPDIKDDGRCLQIDDIARSNYSTHYLNLYHLKDQKHHEWYSGVYLKKVDIINIFDIEI